MNKECYAVLKILLLVLWAEGCAVLVLGSGRVLGDMPLSVLKEP